MQQRRQLQTPRGKVNNDLCQPRSIRGKSVNFSIAKQWWVCCGNSWSCSFCNQMWIVKLSFNNTLCNCRANRVNLQTNASRAMLRKPFKQQVALPLGKLLDGVGKVATFAKGSMLQGANISIRAKFGRFGLQKILKFFWKFRRKMFDIFFAL